jgi:protein TonB
MKMSVTALILFLYFQSYSQGQDTSKIENQIFNSAETEPAFPGGEEKFKDYITLHLHNTEMAVGRIVVQFVVEVDGTLSDIHVVKGLCSKCDAEAIKVMQNSPRWTPGEKDGRKVRVKYSATIIY